MLLYNAIFWGTFIMLLRTLPGICGAKICFLYYNLWFNSKTPGL